MPPLLFDKKVHILFIILFASVTWGGQYYFRGLWEPDEARYTYVAKEMRQTGHMLVPHRNGTFYAHKPPLMFWLINAATVMTHGHFNGIAGRMPTLLGVVLSLWALTRLASLWYDRETAWRAFFILSTSFLFWHKAGSGQIDMLLLGLELSAVYFLFSNDEVRSHRKIAAAFCMMGLAVLAKGPVGLIVPMGIYISANLFSGQIRKSVHRYYSWGLPLALLWPAGWLLSAKLWGAAPDAYFNELLFDQNIGRFQGCFGGHYKPFYYYLKYLVIDFLPWSLFIPGILLVLRKRPDLKTPSLKTAGWMAFVFVFFSLCGGKRNLYILSVYPAAALLTASVLPDMIKAPARLGKTVAYLLILVLLILSLASLIVPPYLPFPVSFSVFLPVSFTAFSGAVLLGRFYKKNGLDQKWFSIFIFIIGLLFFWCGTFVLPAFNAIKTPVALASAVKARLPENQKIFYYAMNGEIQSLYSDRLGSNFTTTEKLIEAMKLSGSGFLVMSNNNWQKLKPVMENWGAYHYFSMGHKTLVWLEYRFPEMGPAASFEKEDSLSVN